MAERTEMGGRDYPADFGTPDPDDVGGRRDAERAAWRAGYAVGFDAGRIEASKQGFSDAWDGGWKAAVKFLWKQGWLRVEELADDPEETEEEREAWAKCTPADGIDSPEMAGREHGVAGVSEFEDLPDWAKRALAERCCSDTAAAVRLPPELEDQRQAIERALNKTWAELDERWRNRTGGTVEDAVKSVLTEAGVEQGWGCRDWAAEAMAEHQGSVAGSLDAAQPEVCDENRCDPCRLPGGWWCRACDKPLRLVRPLYRPDREAEAEGG